MNVVDIMLIVLLLSTGQWRTGVVGKQAQDVARAEDHVVQENHLPTTAGFTTTAKQADSRLLADPGTPGTLRVRCRVYVSADSRVIAVDF